MTNRADRTGRFQRRLLGLVAIGLGLLGFIVRQIGVAPVPYGLSLAMAGAGGLFLLRRDGVVDTVAHPILSERFVIWLAILNLMITNSILILSFHVERRPAFVFFLIAIQAGLIAGQVLLASCSSANTRLLLRSQIVLLSISIILSRLLVFPELGIDIWAQESFAREIVVNGHFPLAATAYKGYPFWPALAGVVAMLTGGSEQEALLSLSMVFSSVALWTVLSGLQHILGHRESLLFGLVLSVSGWFVYWASLAVPMIVTVAIFSAVLVFLFKRRHELQLPLTAYLLMLLAAGAFYHPYASIVSGMLLITVALVLRLFGRLGAEEGQVLLSAQARWAAIGALFAAITTLSVWMYIGDTFDSFMLLIFRSVPELEPFSFGGGYRSPLVYELDYLGFHLLLLVAVARFLRWLDRPAKSVFEITLLSGSLLFLGLNYFSIVTDAFFALPHRWLVYATVLLSVPAAVELWSMARGRTAGMLGSILLVMVLVFTAIANTTIDDDNPFYGEEVAFRQNMTVSETAALEFLDQHRTTSTAVDWQVWNYFYSLEQLGMRPEGITDRFWVYHDIEENSVCPDQPSTLRDLALVRQVYLDRRISGSGCTVEPSGIAELDLAREFSKVYDSGGASFYRRVLEDAVSPGSRE